ncbi:hypothetical protein BAY59_27365 [Prauserella coralliicola]|nr:hypothetical protein BAY59_27365 [Prauserella coralliicola]
MTSLTPEQMLAHFNVHAEAEFNGDIDTTMATVADDPVFEWPCMDLQVVGRDAVREVYLRMFRGVIPKMLNGGRRMFGFGDNTLWGESIFGLEEEDGVVRKHSVLTVAKFETDPTKIKGEYSYGSPGFLKLVRTALGDDIMDVPGVGPLDRERATLIPVSYIGTGVD